MKNYLKNKSVGYYLLLATVIFASLGLLFSSLDGANNIALGVSIIVLEALVIALPIILEIIQTVLKRCIDKYNLLPIVTSVLLTFVLITYIGERVDVLGYIFTGHYSFINDYPQLLFGLIFDVLALVTSIVSVFFKVNKTNNEQVENA